MKKTITSAVVALGFFLSTFVTSSAMAGSYAIGIIAATGKVDTKGSETEGTGGGVITSTTYQENILYGSLYGEYTWGEMYGVTLGASYTPLDQSIGARSRVDTASDANDPGSSDAGTYKAEADISAHTTIYIEPTFMPTDNFGLYLKGGVSRVIVNSLESIEVGEDSSVYGDETVLGGMLGLGAKVVHDSGLLFKLEYTKTMYQTVTMTSVTGNKNTISAEPEVEAVRLAIGYQF